MADHATPSAPDQQCLVEMYSSAEKHSLLREGEESPFSKRRRVVAMGSSTVGDQVCRRVPCKARGLSNSHNADTAYFDIPLRAPHGFLLSCTHPECIESGRRFRYCKVCALPVAKRNFLKRHGHGLIQSNQELKKEVDNPASCQFIFQADEGDDEMLSLPTLGLGHCAPLLPQGLVKPAHRRVVSFDGGSKQLQDPPVPCSDASASSTSSDESLPAMTDGDIDQEETLSPEEKEWLSSLCKEPDANDPSCMGTWMNNMTEWMDRIAASSELPLTSGLGTPNPLLPTNTTESMSNPTPPVPVSPQLQPRSCTDLVMMPADADDSQPAVPLAAPGRLITEGEFLQAIAGVDFSKVFD